MNRLVAIRSDQRIRGFGNGFFLVILFFLLAVAGTAWVYFGMVTTERWPIRWLQVNGSFHRVSAEQLRAQLTPTVSGSFFTVNLSEVRAVAERMAWAETVKVSKTWPDTVYVHITEFQPVAHWTGGKMLSDKGEAFMAPGADEIQGLPWLSGPDGQLSRVWARWQQINTELLPLGLEVDRISLDRRGAWKLTLNNGTGIDLGRDTELKRFRRLVASWRSLTEERELAPSVIDLRYSNGFAVSWPDVAASGTES